MCKLSPRITCLFLLPLLLLFVACEDADSDYGYYDETYGDDYYAEEDFEYGDSESQDDYYETEEDCYSDEYYDPVDQLCYLDESYLDEEDGNYDDVLSEVFNVLAGEDGYEGEGGEEPFIIYQVNGNEITNPQLLSVSSDLQDYQDDTTTHEEIWRYFTTLVPTSYRRDLTKYAVFTDGIENTFAYVAQDEEDPFKWVLYVDIADANNQRELTFTLIHEFGHLLTLDDTQVNLDEEIFYAQEDETIYEEAAAACPYYFPGEGCSQSDSYINLFYDQFWVDIFDEFEEIEFIEDEDEYEQAAADFYDKYQDQFVTDYAATNPAEDIAESWTAFVLQPKPEGNTIAEEKILFFYQFSELVDLRANIASHVYSRLRR